MSLCIVLLYLSFLWIVYNLLYAIFSTDVAWILSIESGFSSHTGGSLTNENIDEWAALV